MPKVPVDEDGHLCVSDHEVGPAGKVAHVDLELTPSSVSIRSTLSSGFVPRPFMRAMTALRFSGETKSPRCRRMGFSVPRLTGPQRHFDA